MTEHRRLELQRQFLAVTNGHRHGEQFRVGLHGSEVVNELGRVRLDERRRAR